MIGRLKSLFLFWIVAFAATLVPTASAAPEGASLNLLEAQIAAKPGERFVGAVTGRFNGGTVPALAIASERHLQAAHLYILHRVNGAYRVVWSTPGDGDFLGSLDVGDVNGDLVPELLAVWVNGQGGYMEATLYSWNGRNYHPMWIMPKSEGSGQRTMSAQIELRRQTDMYAWEVHVRAPDIPGGPRTVGLVKHQVSIYRWNKASRSVTLTRRYTEPQKTRY